MTPGRHGTPVTVAMVTTSGGFGKSASNNPSKMRKNMEEMEMAGGYTEERCQTI